MEEKAVSRSRTHAIYTTAPSVNPWRGESYFPERLCTQPDCWMEGCSRKEWPQCQLQYLFGYTPKWSAKASAFMGSNLWQAAQREGFGPCVVFDGA
jgi:hypothetical protein